MTAPDYFTWDQDTDTGRAATAASLADLGDAQLQDSTKRPPKPPTMPYAAQLNQWALQLAGVNRVIGAATFEVHFTGGTPAISNAFAMSSAITTTWAQANVTITKNGTGDYTLSWPSGALPPPRGKPKAWVTEDAACLQPIALTSGNGVRVKTRNSSGTLADFDFAVRIT